MKPQDDLGDEGLPPESPTFRQALWVWIRIGLLSFGGPAGQIALMHRELVEKRRWLSEHRFMHALNYCMLLPGPEAQQLAVYTGWLLHKTRGGIVAGALFVLPGALLMWVISYVTIHFRRGALILRSCGSRIIQQLSSPECKLQHVPTAGKPYRPMM